MNNTENIELTQTVYGGILDVLTGALSVTHGYKLFNGSEAWSYNENNDLYICSVAGGVITNAATQYNIFTLNNMFQDHAWVGRSSGTLGMYFGASYIFVKDSQFTDVDELKTFLSTKNLQVVYELATPTTVQLTPTEVSTLLGDNNIWADAGEVEVMLTSPTQYDNPTPFASKPLVRVYGNGSVRIGDTIATVQNNTDYIDIDSELMECSDASGARNADVAFSGNDFPELEPGDNSIMLNGPSKIEVTPNYWEL